MCRVHLSLDPVWNHHFNVYVRLYSFRARWINNSEINFWVESKKKWKCETKLSHTKIYARYFKIAQIILKRSHCVRTVLIRQENKFFEFFFFKKLFNLNIIFNRWCHITQSKSTNFNSCPRCSTIRLFGASAIIKWSYWVLFEIPINLDFLYIFQQFQVFEASIVGD